jgi:hypothetical protein
MKSKRFFHFPPMRSLRPACLLLTAAALISVGHAQMPAKVSFNNRVVGSVVAPITSSGVGLLGTDFTAALYVGPAGTTDPYQLTLLDTTTFRTAAAGAGFVNPKSPYLPPATTPGTGYTFEVRAWDNKAGTVNSWAEVIADPTAMRGSSGLFTPPVQAGQPEMYLIGMPSFAISVLTAPMLSISREPQGTNVPPGGTIALDVGYFAWPEPTIQWRLFGTNLPGAASASLLVPNATFANAGPYSVVLSNCSLCVVASPEALVTMSPRLVAPERVNPSTVKVKFDSPPRWPVAVEMTRTLPATQWEKLGAASNATVRGEFLDATATNAQRFYRLRLDR